jgi:tetratricopeptide (TPR) repeat protein
MKTITFYSFKGGVGRSLALSNIAIRLSEYNKKVCIVDFDLEAPGLHYKFKNYSKSKDIDKGIVDYIYKFSCDGMLPENITSYSIKLNPKNKVFEPIWFIPAGNTDTSNYWKSLSSIKWTDLFYNRDSNGVKFFLDLKAKIEKEINPDVLLIDSRTGITDVSGITLKLLADEVVVLGANNEENIYGSKKVIKSLLEHSNSIITGSPKINFVLTRLPFTDVPRDIQKELSIIDRLKNEFRLFLNLDKFEISIIHSDRRLEENEELLIGYEYEEKTVSISNDYLKLFDELTIGVLSESDIKKLKNKKDAEKEYFKSRLEKDRFKKKQHIDKAIKLDSTKEEYFIERSHIFSMENKYQEGIRDLKKALRLNSNNADIYFNMATIYRDQSNADKALESINKAIKINNNHIRSYLLKSFCLEDKNEIEKAIEVLNFIIEKLNPNYTDALNSRADINRRIGKYKEAYEDIFKAISIDPDDPIYFATLAEIYASEDRLEEFYLNLSIALAREVDIYALKSAKDLYYKFKDEERFKNLMRKYSVDIQDIFREE